MSNLLHDTVKVGDRVQLSAPFCDVVLNYSNRPLVLASAGVGLTPMAGMLSHTVKFDTDRKIQLLHADGDSGSFALRRQVEDSLAQLNEGKLDVWFERAEGNLERNENSGYMNIDNVDLPEDAEYYLCGP